MNKQKPEIIRDNKKRGERAETVFAARAAENGLAVSKPSGLDAIRLCGGASREVCGDAGEVHDCRAAEREGIFVFGEHEQLRGIRQGLSILWQPM
jgi:hypothetical protein